MMNAQQAISPLIGQVQENPAYLTEQIITYLGNKRALLSFIGDAVALIKRRLNVEKLSILDAFSGSGIVSRYFKRFARELYVNDLEAYSQCVNECYLTNRSSIDLQALFQAMTEIKLNVEEHLHSGFITELYAPRNEQDIKPGERVFYTVRNARYIDTMRQKIELLPRGMRHFFLAPLLYEASVHNNTAGVFKGFYKNKQGVGQYGGDGKNALRRILGDIDLPMPVFSNFECDYEIYRQDALSLVQDISEDIDLAYLDPPYNQHPYGSNYFMLNLILNYRRPTGISAVSGIPPEWNRSPYNQRKEAQAELFKLIANIRAKFILISYNSEGFVKYDDFVEYLSGLGKLTTMATDYHTFKGCRNLNERDILVKEYLFLLERK